MRDIAKIIVIAASILLSGAPAAAQLSFPTSAEDYPHFYVTAYYDHGGVDWNCLDNTYSGHRGTDFGGGSWTGMEEGRDIRAAAAGVVESVLDGCCDGLTVSGCSDCSGYGNYARVAHYDGLYGVYGHMMLGSVEVEEGDVIACGDPIGLMGSSGNSTGPHLHFEINSADYSVRYDPFAGDCSDAAESMWASQGAYDALPAISCGEPADCEPLDLLTCGALVTASNDGAGSTTGNFYYGCGSEFVYSGPEIAYSFATDLDEPVTVTLTGLFADLDLFVLGGTACDGEDCIAESSEGDTADEALSFDAAAGVEVVIVVDGWEGAVSGFTLGVECDGDLPQEDPPDAGADTDADTDGDTDTDAGTDSDADADSDSDADDNGGSSGSGCGCSAAGHKAQGLLGAIL
ncbi:MAG: M23 family metallopeptidase [Proteobacteria bacterium]|jgi:hypothetical protein|nr:M23 family metallopeptidase [Pseudomonadota bacterium]